MILKDCVCGLTVGPVFPMPFVSVLWWYVYRPMAK